MLGCDELCVEDDVPELTADSEADGTILVVVLHVVHLHYLGPGAILRSTVMEEVMYHVINYVANTVSEEEAVVIFFWHDHTYWNDEEEVVDGVSENGWEDETVWVTRESMMDTMHKEVNSKEFRMVHEIWLVLHMEEKSVQYVLHEGPEGESKAEEADLCGPCTTLGEVVPCQERSIGS